MKGSAHSNSPAMRSYPARQRGVALVVALVLLVVATLIGLASVRGTNLQERMSANMYDRSLAFQRAESALRAAEVAITGNSNIGALGGVDCTVAGTVCNVLPADTFTATSTPNPLWRPVPDINNVNANKTAGQRPEYFIQYMGEGSEAGNFGSSDNIGSGSYSEPNAGMVTVRFYRVTARSSSPADVADRAMVVLQSTVKRAI